MSERDLLRRNEDRWRSQGEGRLDVNGVRWWACDPYPTWYRYDEVDGLRVLGVNEPRAKWEREGPCPVCHDTGLAYDVVEQREVPCGGLDCTVVAEITYRV